MRREAELAKLRLSQQRQRNELERQLQEEERRLQEEEHRRGDRIFSGS